MSRRPGGVDDVGMTNERTGTMTTRREYLTVAVDDTITLAGPVQVEFLDRAEGYRMGLASAPAGGELKLTGTASIVFAKLVTACDHDKVAPVIGGGARCLVCGDDLA